MSRRPARYRRIEVVRPGTAELVTATVCGKRPDEGWALIAPRSVGVCRSDLKELCGTREVRRDFGHEIVAEVVDCAEAGTLARGDLVTLDPHVPVSRTSGFAELVEFHARPDALDQALPRLSPTLAAGPGTFVEPLACAARCVRRVQDALRALGDRPGPVAVVGAGIFGVLIAALLRADGADVCLLNRSRGRLDFLERHGMLDTAEFLTLDQVPRRQFGVVILATTFAEPELVARCAELACERALITVFGGTARGMTTGDDSDAEVDLDALRRGQELREVRLGGRPRWLAGCHGAQRQDFDRAMRALETEPAVTHTVSRLRGPELSLPAAVHALAEYARRPVFGKPIVRIPSTGHAATA